MSSITSKREIEMTLIKSTQPVEPLLIKSLVTNNNNNNINLEQDYEVKIFR